MIQAAELDNRDATLMTAPRNRNSFHKKLKMLSLSASRTSQTSKRASQQNPATNTSDHTAHKKTILHLPVELILSICDYLPLDANACLALTCHHLQHYVGTRLFAALDAPSTRLEKVSVLQKIQKDQPSPNLWLCYACLRFHSTTQRYEPANFRAAACKDCVGFPKCMSIYGQALEEIWGRLHVPRSEWSGQAYWMEDDITSPLRMGVFVSCLDSSTELLMRRRYRLDCRPSDTGRQAPSSHLPVAQLLGTLGTSNLEICPHICFARSWWKGDGSVMSVLKGQEGMGHLNKNPNPMFRCEECRLEMEVHFRQDKAMIIVSVWQHVGRLGYAPDPEDYGAARVDSLEPMDTSLSKSNTSSLLRLPKSWTATLENLAKRRSSSATVSSLESPPEPPPTQPLPNLGDMKKQWESLKEAKYAEYLLLQKKAQTALEARK